MGELSRLPNIGKEVERQLNEAGILSAEDLKNLGAEKAWLKIQKLDPSACIHRLLALEGALRGVKKSLLPPERKDELKKILPRAQIKKRMIRLPMGTHSF